MISTVNKLKKGQISGDLSSSEVSSIDTSIVEGTLKVTLNLSDGNSLSDSVLLVVQGEYVNSVNFVDGVLSATYSETTESLSVNLDNRYLTSLPVHEHEEYEASAKVIIIDRDYLINTTKAGIVAYINDLGVVKEKGETIYVHVKYFEKIIEIVKMEQLFSKVTVSSKLNIESIITIDSITISGDQVSISFNVG